MTATVEVTQPDTFEAELQGPDGFVDDLFSESFTTAQTWKQRTQTTLDQGGQYVVEVTTGATTQGTIAIKPD